MSYDGGKNQIQYRCTQCKTVSPHDNACFVCGSTQKTREIVPLIVQKRSKGTSINIKVR